MFGQNCKPKDCIDLKCYRVSTANDGAMIYPESISFSEIQVTCKQTGDGGGWIVYMRRFNGSLSFKRKWVDYKSGFGEQGESQESWLGNENVHQLIKSFTSKGGGGAQLRIEGYAFNGSSCVTRLDNFALLDETNKYKLKYTAGISTVPYGMGDWEYSKDTWFLTFDKSDENPCFKEFSGGWWFGLCHRAYFTGTYPKNKTTSTEQFYIRSFKMPLKAADMLIRPMNAVRACDNPCKHGGTCKYIAATKTHRCFCPETHCGAKCEWKNPCKYYGACVYSLDKKQISCMCVGSHTGKYCDEIRETETETEPETQGKVIIIAVASLLVVLVVVGGIATAMIVANKRQRARQEQEMLARKEEERQSLLQAEKGKEEEGFFAYLFS